MADLPPCDGDRYDANGHVIRGEPCPNRADYQNDAMGRYCESCAERAWDDAQERAMEGPSRPVWLTRDEMIDGKWGTR